MSFLTSSVNKNYIFTSYNVPFVYYNYNIISLQIIKKNLDHYFDGFIADILVVVYKFNEWGDQNLQLQIIFNDIDEFGDNKNGKYCWYCDGLVDHQHVHVGVNRCIFLMILLVATQHFCWCSTNGCAIRYFIWMKKNMTASLPMWVTLDIHYFK